MHISGRVIKLQMLLALFIAGCGAPGGPPDKASGVIRLVPDVSCSDWTKARMTLLEYGPGGGCSLSQSAYIGNAFEFSIPDNGMENPVYYAVYPSSALRGEPQGESLRLRVPIAQKSSGQDADAAAVVLLAGPCRFGKRPAEFSAEFSSLCAQVAIKLANLPVSSEIDGMMISANVGGHPASLSGDRTYNLPDGKLSGGGEGGSIRLVGDVFACWPLYLDGGDYLTISVEAGGTTYQRNFTLKEGETLAFRAGESTELLLDWAKREPEPEPADDPSFVPSFEVDFSTDLYPVVGEIRHDTREVLLKHIPSASLFTSEEYIVKDGSRFELSGNWPEKTLVFIKDLSKATYRVKLCDAVDPEESFRAPSDWKMAWNDEFTGEDYDRETWRRCRMNGSYASCHHDPGNEDLVSVQDGAVFLWAKKVANTSPVESSIRGGEKVDCPEQDGFSTGGIQMYSSDLKNSGQYLRFGAAEGSVRVDARVRMSSANGFWPAVWLLPYVNQPNPQGGELDLVECATYVGKNYQTAHSPYTAAHPESYALYPRSGSSTGIDWSEYHIFSVEVDAEKLRYYIDGKMTLEFLNREGTPGVNEEQFPFFRTDYRMILSAQLTLNKAAGSSETWTWMDQIPYHYLNGTGLPAFIAVDFIRFYIK